MALSDKDIHDILSKLTDDEKKQLFDKLNQSLSQNDNTSNSVSTDKINCCIHCGSISIIKHGTTSNGIQRYICKDCHKTFSGNYDSLTRYSHLSDGTWKEMLRGFVEELSIPTIANNIGCSTKTVWLAKQKINMVIMDIYGYKDIFQGESQADEFYTRTAFKGKRDPEFFIYTLHRMPRHHRTYSEKVEWLKKAGLYYTLQRQDPEYLEELLTSKMKVKRGISNEQVCVLTLADNSNNLYLEPVSVGRLEKSMAKNKLKPKFKPNKRNVFITDDHNAYNRILYGTQAKHVVVNADKHSKGKYNLAKVNSVHSALTSYMNPKSGKVFNTKYLDLTLILFWWLQKNKKYSTEQKVNMLYDIFMSNSEKIGQITYEDIVHREISIDTKGTFPTRL